ncbi:MAG: NAD(P)-binding protein, partial [Clostridia bacterium]|nr:NAD(P)-binding protein [Clostridia bacterium]
AVIGGGPAGLEASRILAERKFKVVLFEKTDKLGGALNLANKPLQGAHRLAHRQHDVSGKEAWR